MSAPIVAPITEDNDSNNETTCRKRRVVGLHGRPGAGKSLAAEYLQSEQNFKRGKFANALKEMLRTFLRYRNVDDDVIERMLEGDLKSIETPYFCGRTPRHAMQTLGTQWGRDCISPNLWVESELHATQHVQRLVFDDVRFPNEADAINKANGTIIHIVRPREEQEGDDVKSNKEHDKERAMMQHASETQTIETMHISTTIVTILPKNCFYNKWRIVFC